MPQASTRSSALSSSISGSGRSRGSSLRGAVCSMARLVRGAIAVRSTFGFAYCIRPKEGARVKALPRLSHPGGVDGDGHVLEPPDLWERYLEPPLRSRALRIGKD